MKRISLFVCFCQVKGQRSKVKGETIPTITSESARERVSRCEKVESEHRSSRNPIGRPGNQWKSSFLKSSLGGEEGHMKKISLFVCVCGRSTVRLQEKRSDLLVFVRHLRQEKGD